MARASHRVRIFGRLYIPDGRVKRLLRKSPPANARARAIAKCARGKDLTTRKQCFSGSKGVKGP